MIENLIKWQPYQKGIIQNWIGGENISASMIIISSENPALILTTDASSTGWEMG